MTDSLSDSDANSIPALDPHRLREDFPILCAPQSNGKPLVYLDNAATTQKPEAVLEAQAEVDRTFYANAYRGVYRIGNTIDERLEASRGGVRDLINARESAEIAFTSGATHAINTVARGWGEAFLSAGDEIVLTIMEHHANLVPWIDVAQKTGAVLKYAPVTTDGRLDMEAFEDLLTERTKLVAVTGMSNVLGTSPDLDRVTELAHGVGAKVLVDAAQLICQQPIDVQQTPVDWLVFSGHKIHAPSGVGVLYGRREIMEEMQPAEFGGHMIAEVYLDSYVPAELPAKFEAGTLPISQAISLGTAIEYVQQIGLPAIHDYKAELGTLLDRRLHEVGGVTVFGPPPEERGGVTSFTVDGVHPQDLATLLDRFGVCVRHGHHCTMPLHDHLGVSATTRASLTFYNTPEDVETFIEGVEYACQRLRR